MTTSRLRTLPYLPPSQRPDLITSKAGAEISVDKAKVEGKERILRRGEVGGVSLSSSLLPHRAERTGRSLIEGSRRYTSGWRGRFILRRLW